MLQVEDNEDGEIVIKNYVPTKRLTTTEQLYKSDIVDEAATLKNQIASDETINSQVIYNGEDVISLPQYFDRDFIKAVKGNNNHILLPTP